MTIQILGVHPVTDATEPCHLIEVAVDTEDGIEFGKVTQEISGQPASNWQVAYDEQPVEGFVNRWCFFFHYLDDNQPLLTPNGAVALVEETPIPNHLENVRYEPPC